MSGPQSFVTITLSAEQQAVLEALQRQATCSQALALRVRIVLGIAAEQRVGPLATLLGCSRFTIRIWRNRWVGAESQLAVAEADWCVLRQMGVSVLADAPRSGTPATFSAEQIVQIINLACTSPRAAGRPVDAWTPRELADQAERQGIVSSISPTTVGRFLGRSRASAAS